MIGVAFLVKRLLPHAHLSLLFLTGVLFVSARTGLGPSLVASLLSFLAYNYFFTPPYFTFEVADDGDVETLVLFLVMAAITGNLAGRMYNEMAEKQASLQRISNLYRFSQKMSSATERDSVLNELANHLFQSLNKNAVLVFYAGERDKPEIGASAGDRIQIPQAILDQAWTRNSGESFKLDAWYFRKFAVSSKNAGMLAIAAHDLQDSQLDLVASLSDQAALVLDRMRLVTDLEQARVTSETEQLRSALLSSVSHDLRTPLASIIGSSTSLIEYGESFSEANRKELLETVANEAQRLDRHIQNLLDMTRLGQGSLSLQRDWVDLNDIIASSVSRLRNVLGEIKLDIQVSDKVPLLWIHGVLIEQALVNLLDNAIRFSPDQGHIVIAADADAQTVSIDVCDEGPGIAESEREKVFDMFYSMRQDKDDSSQGTGLGLAICRGMLGAHGGNVSVADGRSGRGTCMHIELPLVVPEQENA